MGVSVPTPKQKSYWERLIGKPPANIDNHGKEPWNKGKKTGIQPTNTIQKGQRLSPNTEFKKGLIPWSKLNPDFQRGVKHWNWKGGKPKCLICGRKLGGYQAKYCNPCASRLFRSGENNTNWNGGITPLRKLIRELPKYREWRIKVFKRDKYSCVWCGCDISGLLNADHFPIAFADIIKKFNIKSTQEAVLCRELWDVNNGRTLCVDCHKKTPNYFRRKK